MNYAQALKQFKEFMAMQRAKVYDLGLEPEFSVIETFVLKEGIDKLIFLRENLDRFWNQQRGLTILEQLRDKAKEQRMPLVAEGLDQFREEIHQLFLGQFLYYSPEKFTELPHTVMLQKLCQMMNEYDTDKILKYIDQELSEFDGHFFIILGISMRNARSQGASDTVKFFEVIGRTVAQKRLQAGFPCSFAYLFGVQKRA